jgi:hypothetical protein
MHVHTRLLPEYQRDRVREPIDQPLLAEVVVEHHQPARLEAGANGAERFLREHVALEPHAREARLHGEGIDQRENDQDVLLRRGGEKMPRVVDDRCHVRIVVGMIGLLAVEPQDHRIDLNRGDVLRAVAQRGGDVGSIRRRNQHVVERVAERGTATGRNFPCGRPAPSTAKDVVDPDDSVVAVPGR